MLPFRASDFYSSTRTCIFIYALNIYHIKYNSYGIGIPSILLFIQKCGNGANAISFFGQYTQFTFI